MQRRSLHKKLPHLILSVLAGATLLVASSQADAARVTKVKGKTVLIDVESSTINEGEKYFIIIDGKKKGVVQISKVKNGKALGTITKGRADVDAGVEPTKKTADGGDGGGDSGGNPDDLVLKKGKKSKKSGNALYIGALVGFAMDAQTLPDPAGNSVSMSGSGYSLKAFGDLPISGGMGAIGRLGIEQFSVKGTSPYLGSVQSSILYMTGDVLLRYRFTDGTFVPYLGVGVGIHFPISKSSNILNVPQISATSVFFLEGGFNYNMSSTTYITILADYGIFPPSNNVSTSLIAVRAGLGFRF